MYLPLAFYDELVASGAVFGPRGGITLGEDQLGRWINNTLFAALMGEGWVGSTRVHTDRLSKIVDDALHGGRLTRARRGQPRSATQRSWVSQAVPEIPEVSAVV